MSTPTETRVAKRQRSAAFCTRLLAPWLALALCWVVGCTPKPGKRLSHETVKAACAMCIFKMQGVRGCLWAVEVDRQFYLAEGALPKNHEPHGPDGMCNMAREAVVDGELRHGKFVATRFELRPASSVPTHSAPAHQH